MATERQTERFKKRYAGLLESSIGEVEEEVDTPEAHELLAVAASIDERIRRKHYRFGRLERLENICVALLSTIRDEHMVPNDVAWEDVDSVSDPDVPRANSGAALDAPWSSVCFAVKEVEGPHADVSYHVETDYLGREELRHLAALLDLGWGVAVRADEAFIAPAQTMAVTLIHPDHEGRIQRSIREYTTALDIAKRGSCGKTCMSSRMTEEEGS